MTPTPDSPEVTARVREHLGLVDAIAVQLRRELHVPAALEDLASFGREGLLRAARSFDESRGVPFGAWAALRIRGAMIDGLRAWGPLPRRAFQKLRAMAAADAMEEALTEEDAARAPQTAQEADERLQRYLSEISTSMVLASGIARESGEPEEDEGGTPEDKLASEQLARALREAVARLPDEERRIVESYYFQDKTIDEAAREIGLSKSWASRIHTRAVERITRDLKRNRVVP